jgi:hypothetical protein
MNLRYLLKNQWSAHPFQGDTSNRVKVGQATVAFLDEYESFKAACRRAQKASQKTKEVSSAIHRQK